MVPIEVSGSLADGLVDTGALGNLFINEKHLDKFGVLDTKFIPPLKLISFAGNVGQIVNRKVKLEFKIQKSTFQDYFMVLNRCSNDIILGLEWLQKHDAVINCQSKSISFGMKTSVSLSKRTLASCISLSAIQSLSSSEELPIYSYIVRLTDSKNVSSVHATPGKINSLPLFLKSYADVFNLEKLKVLPTYNDAHAMPIELIPGSVTPTSAPYKISDKEETALRTALQEGLKSGIISISQAPGGCPILFVKKPDGTLRLCVDYRSLNKLTRDTQAILPNIEDILSNLSPSKDPIYSKIDLKGAFHQLRIKIGDEEKTTFVTKFGSFS